MTDREPVTASQDEPEHLDVIIGGAGVSGIGMARYVTVEHPELTLAVLEARAATGGTWDLFRYPGIRSDSDLYTFGYEFKPWRGRKAIADASSILDYVRETADDYGITARIRLRHKIISASWSTPEARWTVEVDRTDELTGAVDRVQLTCRWLVGCGGYYSYEGGYAPHFEGMERYGGPIIHPQAWPDGLDHAGKRVVVIGSGATAVTLVPALATSAAHVTMLQRTPTYVLSVPAVDALGTWLPRIVGPTRAHALTRRKNIGQQRLLYRICQKHPSLARKVIRAATAKQLPAGFDVDTHFNPPYDPWDQRLCIVPDGDLFECLRDGSASVVTDRIETFTERGIRLASGRELEADIIVTATGLTLLPMGGIALTVDGREVAMPETVAFKGMMLSGVPNFAFVVGYTNASWTLKVGLIGEHFSRLLTHMHEKGYAVCVPVLPPGGIATRPLLDLGSGYIQRALGELPRQGVHYPWSMAMDFRVDEEHLRRGPVADDNLRFLPAGAPLPEGGAVRSRDLVAT